MTIQNTSKERANLGLVDKMNKVANQIRETWLKPVPDEEILVDKGNTHTQAGQQFVDIEENKS